MHTLRNETKFNGQIVEVRTSLSVKDYDVIFVDFSLARHIFIILGDYFGNFFYGLYVTCCRCCILNWILPDNQYTKQEDALCGITSIFSLTSTKNHVILGTYRFFNILTSQNCNAYILWKTCIRP